MGKLISDYCIIAPELFKVDEDRVIEYSADALRCSYIDMVSANMTGDCQNKMKSITFTSY